MKGKKIAMMLLQASGVVLFAGGFYVYTQNQIEPVKVYQFSRDISPNTKISESDLVQVDIPEKAVNPTFELDPNKIVGKYNATKVFKNEYVIKDKIVKKEDVDPFESIDLTKLRKVSIPVSYSEGIGGNIKRGDRIDLVYVGEAEKKENGESKGQFSYSKTFMSDVLVYGATTTEGFEYRDRTENVKGDQAKEDGKELETQEDTGELAQLIVAVNLDQAEEITARLKTGEIKVVGRFSESQNYDSSGYIQGEFSKVFSGEGIAENNK